MMQTSPLSGQALENIVAFCNLMGYVRYFHPSDQSASVDWEVFSIEGLRAVEQLENAGSLSEKLVSLFKPIAPTLVVAAGDDVENKPKLQKSSDLYGIVKWHHHGLLHSGPLGFLFSSDRVVVQDAADESNAPYRVEIGSVSCLVPIALPIDASGTYPHIDLPIKMQTPSKHNIDDRVVRLAIVCILWNAIKHFYPYFDVVETSWTNLLSCALKEAAMATSAEEFYDVLCRLTASLDDGHARVYHPNHDEWKAYSPLFSWDWLEDCLVITNVKRGGKGGFGLFQDSSMQLDIGDVVTSIDGKTIDEAISSCSRLVSGSTKGWIRYRVLERLLAGAKGQSLAITVRKRSGEKLACKVPRTIPMWRETFRRNIQEPRPEIICELSERVFYLDLTRATSADFYRVLPKLEKARGIILDVRGYPPPADFDIALIGHFIDKVCMSATSLMPVVSKPEEDKKTYVQHRFAIQPLSPRLKAKLAFITDCRAISHSEGLIGIVEHYKLAPIIGERTAGCYGVPVFFNLPCGYIVTWTGTIGLKHNGSRYHGTGINPTIEVMRSIDGIVQGKDEMLEQAIKEVSS